MAFNLPITFTPIGFARTISGKIKSSVRKGAESLFAVKGLLNGRTAQRRNSAIYKKGPPRRRPFSVTA
jgi:hypothetical protein